MRKTIKKIKDEKTARTYRRKLSIRNKITGSADRPRVTISKGNKNIYVQVIDDTAGVTVASSQTFGKSKVGNGSNVESAKVVGADIAGKLKAKSLNNVVFDRNGLKYCGIVEAVAQSMRDQGISL